MVNEKRLIYADEIEELFYKQVEWGATDLMDAFDDALQDAQTVDAVEVVHGYNLDEDTPSLFECSICHWSCSDTYYGDTEDYNYCPNCGAKMDGDGDG